MKTEIKLLDVKANDNYGKKRDVYLTQEQGEEVCVYIDQTPGRWSVSTLLGVDDLKISNACGDTLYVDYGQDWKILNMLEVLAEVREKTFAKFSILK